MVTVRNEHDMMSSDGTVSAYRFFRSLSRMMALRIGFSLLSANLNPSKMLRTAR